MQTDVRQNIYCTSDGSELLDNEASRDSVKVRNYSPASWLTPEGAKKKQNLLFRKGFPNIRNWRFLTMTVDRERFNNDPEAAYDYITKNMRFFFRKLREIEGKDFRYCWKLEFHPDSPDWPHWHAIVEVKKKIDVHAWRNAWGFGRFQVQRANKKAQSYLTKYITKGMDLPEWVLDRERIRFFQTSKDFYDNYRQWNQKKCRQKQSKNSKQGQCVKTTIRQRLENWSRTLSVSYQLSVVDLGKLKSSASLPEVFRVKTIYKRISLLQNSSTFFAKLAQLKFSKCREVINFQSPLCAELLVKDIQSLGSLIDKYQSPYSLTANL
jgi:hypothetical protein